jgi:hypothetical protein
MCTGDMGQLPGGVDPKASSRFVTILCAMISGHADGGPWIKTLAASCRWILAGYGLATLISRAD